MREGPDTTFLGEIVSEYSILNLTHGFSTRKFKGEPDDQDNRVNG